MATIMRLVLFVLISLAAGKSPGETIDETFQEIQGSLNNLSSNVNDHYNDLTKKYQKLKNDLKIFKILHGPCAPCVTKQGSNRCDCRNLEPKRDCLAFRQAGIKINGMYKVLGSTFHYAYCDQTTDGGGWTVIQRRKDGSENFYRNWNDYKNGFGNLEGEFWFGNDNIYDLTSNLPKKSSLLINMVIHGQSKQVWVKYSSFSIGDESTKYTLHVSGFSGNTTNRLMTSCHNNMKFSTKDQHNDGQNTATTYKSAWWYCGGYNSHLNGVYSSNSYCAQFNWGCNGNELSFSEMKVRRNI